MLEVQRSMSLPLTTVRTTQAPYFHRDMNTLGTRSNVAGTGEPGARVIVAFRYQLEEVLLSIGMCCGKAERFLNRQHVVNGEFPLFDFRVVT